MNISLVFGKVPGRIVIMLNGLRYIVYQFILISNLY